MSTTTGLTRAPAGGAGRLHVPGHPAGTTPQRPSGINVSRIRDRLVRLKLYGVLILLMLPSLLMLFIFTYVPQFNAIRYSLYKWKGTPDGLEYVGFKNFLDAFRADTRFWQSFRLVLLLLAANVVKMAPSIGVAVAMHRLKSERWQYVYRVLFVIPMIIPGVVSVLIWKSFFDAGTGALNAFLNATHLMAGLARMDVLLARTAGSAFAIGLRERWNLAGVNGLWWVGLTGVGMLMLSGIWKRRSATVPWIGTLLIVAVAIIALLTCAWPTRPTHAFDFGTPAWLGNENLLIPAILFWGFPWVGTVGVLIYLAGLQSITTDVYEAAELDGVGSVRRLTAIELPLILTQVRINLIFLTIGTITDYGLFFLLLGPTGGPGGRGMVPGLYMYQTAFLEQRYGYACALGMILFVLLLAITALYQKYVRVEK